MSKLFKKYKRFFFTTEKVSGFSPTIANSGHVVWWLNTNEAKIEDQTATHDFISSGNKPVEVAIEKPEEATEVTFTSDQVIGAIDFSLFTKCRKYNCNSSPNLNSVTFPVTNTIVDVVSFNGCGVNTIVDLSGFTSLEGTVIFSNGNAVTSFVWPTTSGTITNISIQSGYAGVSLDLSPLDGQFRGFINARTNPNLQTVVFPIANNDVTAVFMYSNDMQGNMDFSPFGSHFKASVEVNNNDITSFTFPVTSKNVGKFWAQFNDLTSVDFSNIATMSGSIQLQGNSTLTTITYAPSSAAITLNISGCDITGSHILTNLTHLSSFIDISSNLNMTSVTFPTTTQVISNALLDTTGVTAYDLTPMSALEGNLQVNSCPNLATITLPATSGVFTSINASFCALTAIDITPLTGSNDGIEILLNTNSMLAAEVDQFYIDVDAKGWLNVVLNTVGNAAPTATSAAARSNIISNGGTITT